MDFFDLHCDTLTKSMIHSANLTDSHLDIHIGNQSGIVRHCQCFAVFCPDTISGADAFNYYKMAQHHLLNQTEKFDSMLEQVKCAKDIASITAKGKTAAILTVEGGRVLAGSLENLYALKNDGVKMITLTWNGENEIGCGSVDQSFGLKPFGFELIKEMEKCGVQIDVSHLSDKGLSDVLKTVSCPVVASHSNLRAVCSHRRNLTDDDFSEIVRRGGIVGINFYKDFLNDESESASLSDIARHIERMLLLGGENAVCMGSDYDGCDVVDGIKNIDELPRLYDFLLKEGFGKALLEKIFWKNAYNYFCSHI